MVQSKEQTTVSDGVGFIKSLAFSGDGAWLAFAGSDDTVKIWDIKQGHVLWDEARSEEIKRMSELAPPSSSSRSASGTPDPSGLPAQL
jgi:WD40 repeat protein